MGDLLLRLGAAAAPAAPSGLPDTAVVAIDPRSLRAHPEWPWPRALHARAVRALDRAGARAIAFDVDFSTPRDPEDDARLAEAMRESGRVVLAAFRQLQILPGGAELEIANVPAAAFADSAAAIGSVLVDVDGDGVVRSAPLGTEIGARAVPPLAAAALAVAQGDPPAPAADAAAVDAAPLRIDYRRADPAFPVLSITDVIDGRFDPRDVSGRVVFVGATAAEFQDLWTTPLGPAVPGVFIQATIYRTLAAERAGAPVATAPARERSRSRCCSGSRSCSRRWPACDRSRASRPSGAAVWCCAPAAWSSPRDRGCCGARCCRWRSSGRTMCSGSRRCAAGSTGASPPTTRPCRRWRRSVAPPPTRAAVTTWPWRCGCWATWWAPAASRSCDPTRTAASTVGGSSGARPAPRRRGASVILDTASAILAQPRRRVFEGAIPGAPERSGVAVYAPLMAGDILEGVLVVECAGADGLDDMQLRTIDTVGAQLALSANNLRLVDGLRQTFNTSIAAIASAVEARDGYTDLHCRRLAAFSRIVAERMNVAPDEVDGIELGALLHDVGKIGIRDEILLKPGAFSFDERREMERHPDIGAGIVGGVHGLSGTTLACVRHHHERWDGSGYPDALAGDAIPLGARIVSVVDVWDALSTARPYKPAFSQSHVIELLRKGRGVQFDPEVVDVFLAVLEEQGEEMLALIERDVEGRGE